MSSFSALYSAELIPHCLDLPPDDSCFSLTCHSRETPKDTRPERFKGFKQRTDDGKCLTSVNYLALSLKKKKKNDLLSVAPENLIFSLKEVVPFTPKTFNVCTINSSNRNSSRMG